MTNVINIEQCEGQSLDIEITSNDRGPEGQKGETGATGTTFTPTVQPDGTIYWTNDGGKENPQQRNIKGPRGEKGETGERGSNGRDGAIQYTAGTGIDITNNVISVTSASAVAWGAITGDIKNQTDLSDSLSAIENDVDDLQISVNGIEEKIPAQATYSNQLADKDFVNSSIATNTATFKGTYNSIAELPTTGVTNNDYAFVVATDAHGNTVYNRYKWNGTAWVFEYVLNNSSFTAAQWATIQSGLTSADKTKLDGLATVATTGAYADLSGKPTVPVITMTSTDPGEGQPLAANNYIFVYEA